MLRNLKHQRCSRAFTLIELMLVLALIVAFASISVPMFRNSFAVERLRRAGDAVRTVWAKARLDAMRSGQTHVFRFDYGVNTYVVALWETGDTSTEASDDVSVAQKTGQLPGDAVFYAGEKVVDARTQQIEGAGGQTAPQIFFYPDGTTSTAQVLLSNGEQRFLRVELRGLTGIARAGDVMSSADVGLQNYGT
jgi:prepilin-type N-terminal cleavage/methylation domain-containing protein